VIGTGQVESLNVEWRGQSALELLVDHWPEEWQGVGVDIGLSGRKLTQAEAALSLPDDVDVIVMPTLDAAATAGQLIVNLILAVGVSLALNALIPKPEPEGVGQETDDARSPTYGFAGIRTTYGQGYIIPIVLGEHDVGGQVIDARLQVDLVLQNNSAGGASFIGESTEKGQFILALSEGRIESVGGVVGGDFGEVDGMGGSPGDPNPGPPIPSNVRVNGNTYEADAATPGIRVWYRGGELDQSPLPAPFIGSSVIDAPDISLPQYPNTGRATYTILDVAPIQSVSLILFAPQGLFGSVQGGNTGSGQIIADPASYLVEWRPVGESAWRPFYDDAGQVVPLLRFTRTGPNNSQSVAFLRPTAREWRLNLLPASQTVSGPIEVSLAANNTWLGSNNGDGSFAPASPCLLRNVEWATGNAFAYPRIGLVGLSVDANSSGQVGLPEFKLRVQGIRVRAWDPNSGWSDYGWQRPLLAPWNIYDHPIGQNPAWLAVEFLLAPWGLGSLIAETQIDLEAFGRWAVYCDEIPAGWSEGPRYAFDGVLDRQKPAWETLQMIASAGAASIFLRGNTVSVVYRYRDSHGSGTPFAVGTRDATQLISAPMIRDMRVEWLPTKQRPHVLAYQYLNAEKNYVGDVLDVEDPDTATGPAAFNAPEPSKQVNQVFGITRAEQLYRQGVFEHRIARLVRKRVTFRVPFFALAAEVGDLVALQTDVVLPFENESLGLTVLQGGVGVTSVTVDQVVVIEAAKTYDLLARSIDGSVEQARVQNAAGTYQPGDAITLQSAVDIYDGAPASIGVVDQVVELYEITSLTLEENLDRQVTALEWTPDAYDVPPESGFSDGAPEIAEGSVGDNDTGQSTYSTDVFRVDPSTIRLYRKYDGPGWELAWAHPYGRSLDASSRVYVRRTNSGAPFLLQVEVGARRTWCDLADVNIGDALDVVVVVTNRRGVFPPVAEADAAALVVPEFRDVPWLSHSIVMRDVAFEPIGAGNIRVRWQPTDDVVAVEVRKGLTWDHGAQVAVLPATAAEFVDYDAARMTADKAPSYWVAGRASDGLYGPATAATDVAGMAGAQSVFAGGGTAVVATAELVDPVPGGTLDNLVHGTDDELHEGFAMAAGASDGSYTSAETEVVLLDDDGVEFEALAHWSVVPAIWARDSETLDDWTWRVGNGEGMHRSIDIRPATLGLPGILEDTIDDWFDGRTLDDVDQARVPCWVHPGEIGRRYGLNLESRYYTGGAWSSWAPHSNGLRRASRVQLRASLWRESDDLVVMLESLEASVTL
jgi:hypothetical protein